MTIEHERDIEALRAIGQIVARCLQTLGGAMRPGMTTAELDAIAERFLAEHGAKIGRAHV